MVISQDDRMTEKPINIHAAKTRLSQLIARAECGERTLIARDGKPVALLGPAPKAKHAGLPPGEPLLNLGDFAADGDPGVSTNEEIDQVLYGKL
jgi:antitoxin (DNA-binding transcriptional repressor) of toxin-antitoxin stability system